MAGLGYNNANATLIVDSIETAVLLEAPVSSAGYVAPATWSAGQIGYLSSGQMIVVDGSAASTSVMRVLVTTKTAAQDETLPSGHATYVSGPHTGRTTLFNTSITSATAPGTGLFVDTAGKFCLTADGAKVTSCPKVAVVRWCDGTTLAYEWILAQ